MQHRLNSVARSRHGIAILERLDQLVQNGPSLEFNYFHSLSAAENPGQPTALVFRREDRYLRTVVDPCAITDGAFALIVTTNIDSGSEFHFLTVEPLRGVFTELRL